MLFYQLCRRADFFVCSSLLFAKKLTNNILGTKVVHLEFHCISIINLWKLRRAKMEETKVYTPRELMGILKLGRNKVYELLQLDIIKSVKIGRSYRVEEKDLKEYLTAHK